MVSSSASSPPRGRPMPCHVGEKAARAPAPRPARLPAAAAPAIAGGCCAALRRRTTRARVRPAGTRLRRCGPRPSAASSVASIGAERQAEAHRDVARRRTDRACARSAGRRSPSGSADRLEQRRRQARRAAACRARRDSARHLRPRPGAARRRWPARWRGALSSSVGDRRLGDARRRARARSRRA